MLNNIFSALSSYGSTEGENYLTESFVHLLRVLLERSPEVGLAIANHLTGRLPVHPLDDARQVTLRTQVAGPQGTPDIEIAQGEDTLVYIEIKQDSPLASGQLEAYLQMLDATGRPNRRLVLLTRSRAGASGTTLARSLYHHVCWYEVFDWLGNHTTSDEVSRYLMDQFRAFLEEKNMNLRKVTWEYEQGVRAMLDLATMLEIAAKEALPGASIRRTAGWSWRGLYIDNYLFCGVRFESPLLLVLENNMGTKATAAQRLDLEAKHFLALKQGEQFEMIVAFLREAAPKVPKGDAVPEPRQPDDDQ